jgi:hypothetical protein
VGKIGDYLKEFLWRRLSSKIVDIKFNRNLLRKIINLFFFLLRITLITSTRRISLNNTFSDDIYPNLANRTTNSLDLVNTGLAANMVALVNSKAFINFAIIATHTMKILLIWIKFSKTFLVHEPCALLSGLPKSRVLGSKFHGKLLDFHCITAITSFPHEVCVLKVLSELKLRRFIPTDFL